MYRSVSFLVAAFFTYVSPGFGQNLCNEEDLNWMAEFADSVQQVATDCGLDCLFDANPELCMEGCMTALTPLSPDCISCFSGQADCASTNCFLTCLFGSEEACTQCVQDNCQAAFQDCAGIYDLDGDTFTNLSDCNDNDPNIYPGAPEIWYDGIDQNCDGLSDFDQDMDGEDAFEYGGLDCNDLDPNVIGGLQVWYFDADLDGYGNSDNSTLSCVSPPGTSALEGDCDDDNSAVYPGATGTNEGIDNDCNGVVEGDEVICLGDFNGDLIVNTNDLLSLLSQFGCEVDCTTDLDNSGGVNTADLLTFLSAFGLICYDQ